jgi:hypothetical protein
MSPTLTCHDGRHGAVERNLLLPNINRLIMTFINFLVLGQIVTLSVAALCSERTVQVLLVAHKNIGENLTVLKADRCDRR